MAVQKSNELTEIAATLNTFVLLCYFYLWKRRNAVVFRGVSPSLSLTLNCCRDNAMLWHDRLAIDSRVHMDVWLRALVESHLAGRGVG